MCVLCVQQMTGIVNIVGSLCSTVFFELAVDDISPGALMRGVGDVLSQAARDPW